MPNWCMNNATITGPIEKLNAIILQFILYFKLLLLASDVFTIHRRYIPSI